MKKYALKTSRNAGDHKITIHPVTVAPPGAKPYFIRRPRPYYVESCQIFSSRDKALEAEKYEKIAAEFAEYSDEKLVEMFRKSIDKVANLGISAAQLCKLTNTSYATATATMCKGAAPSSRLVARFHIFVERLSEVANFGLSLLPNSGGCGNPKMGRGGRPDIYLDQKRFKDRSR